MKTKLTDLSTVEAEEGSVAIAEPRIEVDPIFPLTLYGPELSYYTGKLEAVIRYMGLPYKRVMKEPMGDLAAWTGTAQVPGLQLADDRWLTDSTPIIAWLDERYPEVSIIPGDPVTAFFSRLLEDYADEWLWRPAMHYRWDYEEGAQHQSRVLADADQSEIPLPLFLKRYLIRNRQRKLFTKGDGVTPETWDHVEKIFYDSLTQFNTILKTRPYLLGARPSLADFGFFGPMFRHFSMDPTSARIMRETAPAVFEWVARMWNARADEIDGDLLEHVPDDWGPILDSIGSAYLPYLCANAEAWKAGSSHFDVDIEGAPYRRIRTAPYRVWCLEELQRHFNELSEVHQCEVRTRLEVHGCWTPLWRVEAPLSGVDPDRKAPFASSGSMTGVKPIDAEKLHWLPVSAAKRSRYRTKENMMSNNTANSPGKPLSRRMLKIMAKVHVFLHRLTGGRVFNTLAGGEVCFVTMTGAKSGRQVTVPLLHLPYEDGVLLVASQTGRTTNPVWYKNLVKHPEIEVRHRRDKLKLRAREATIEEKADLWPICDQLYADFAQYRARTTRDIPIFICEPA